MTEYIVCFMNDNGKSLVSKTNKYDEFNIFKIFMDWCSHHSAYFQLFYGQLNIKDSIESYVKPIITNEYINETNTFKHNNIILDMYIAKLKPRSHITYTKSTVINLELYLENKPNDKVLFNCSITKNNDVYSLEYLNL